MPRKPRLAVADVIYHVINRANGRTTIFQSDKDYLHFESLLQDAIELTGMRLLGYCVMPNHWHLILYPSTDSIMSECMGWLTSTHTRQYRTRTKTIGYGHLYQDRYKSFPVDSDKHFVDLLRYVEQNPLRAKLVQKAEQWKWGSLYRRQAQDPKLRTILAELPSNLPDNYLDSVNTILGENELEEIRYSVNKGKPYGNEKWVEKIVGEYGMGHTTRGPGRPRL